MKPLELEVDLTQIQGDGNFSCPKCGVTISPEDEKEELYRIVETKSKDQALEELVIQCNGCESRIHLLGFHILDAYP